MTPGDRPSIPLGSEPVEWLHPALVGTVEPGVVQPVDHVPALEEEPALWFSPAGARRGPLRAAPTPRRSDGPPSSGSDRTLPATGSAGGVALGAVLVALGWVLHRRRGGTGDR